MMMTSWLFSVVFSTQVITGCTNLCTVKLSQCASGLSGSFLFIQQQLALAKAEITSFRIGWAHWLSEFVDSLQIGKSVCLSAARWQSSINSLAQHNCLVQPKL